MAFDFIKNKLTSKGRKVRLSHIKLLLAAELVDNRLDKAEANKLVQIAIREGLSINDFTSILHGRKNNLEYIAPEDEETKILYLNDLISMITIDNQVDDKELAFCMSAAQKMCVSKQAMKEAIDRASTSVVPSHSLEKQMDNQIGYFIKDDRYYFHDGHCSFKLPQKEELSFCVKNNGMTHILTDYSMIPMIIDIRDKMPLFDDSPITTRMINVAGCQCLEVDIMGFTKQFFINCQSFVVQVSGKVTPDFLNSFKLEK